LCPKLAHTELHPVDDHEDAQNLLNLS